MENLNSFVRHLEWFYKTQADERTTEWFLMDSPLPVFVISLTYLALVKIAIPRLMEDRKPFDIKKILLFYNAFHLLANVIFFYFISWLGWLTTYNWRCEPVDRSPFGIPYEGAVTAWLFLIFKHTDYLETFILLFGKRSDLVTGYHFAHHLIMPNMLWWVVKFVPGGHGTFFGFVNTFSHMIMYSYLLLIGIFPSIKKKQTTLVRATRVFLSAAEIILVLCHTLQLLFKNDCGYPIEFVYYVILIGLLYLTLSMTCNTRQKASYKRVLEDVK